MKFTVDGKEWETFGEYRIPTSGDLFISDSGVLTSANGYYTKPRLIVKPKPVQHFYNGIVFEETGECHMPRVGEWYVSESTSGEILACTRLDYVNHVKIIVKPVAIME